MSTKETLTPEEKAELVARAKAATEEKEAGLSQIEALAIIGLQRILPEESMAQPEVKEELRNVGVKVTMPLSLVVYLSKIGATIINSEQKAKSEQSETEVANEEDSRDSGESGE